MKPIESIMRRSPVIAVITLDDPAPAEALACALVEGGITSLEVTLRTPAALEVLTIMARVDGAQVGAGTIVTARQANQALEAGAGFLVSPGLTEPLVHEAARLDVPYLPGISTASDIMRGLDLGIEHFKFFPAEASGGIPALKALAAPFHQARFCPTGGITPDSLTRWLGCPGVLCVGGSWLVPHAEAAPSAVRDLALAVRQVLGTRVG